MQCMHDNLWMHTVFCYRFVNGGVSMSATSKLGHTSINWVLPWGIETNYLWKQKASKLMNWLLVWRFTTMVSKHYMHTAKMKKHGFIKNKVVEHIVNVNIKKATLILHINVTHGIDDSNKTGHAWMVWNQQHLNMTYKVPFPFTKYVCCTCEWVLHGNLCKHQVVILLTCIDLTNKNIIQYCKTRYGSNHGGFATMGCRYARAYDTRWYLPQCGKREIS